MNWHRTRALSAALLVVALAALGLAGSAQAKLTGNYTKFAQCPFNNTEVKKCLYATTVSGEVVLGSKKVPIVNPVVLQGGYGKTVESFAPFFAATNGITLAKVAQPVPGGLAGLVSCPEIKEPFLRFACELTFENGLTGLNSTLELAKPASEIRVSELNLAAEENVALKMPVKVHLENPFLGKNCFVGSSTSPIQWELTTGETSPPEPNKPIFGSAGLFKILEEGRILETTGTKLVDNKWSAPTATGCGGIISFLVTPIINGQLGSTTAGHNTAILNNTVFIGSALSVSENNAANP